MEIKNTVALVTGGASGLGRATVDALLAKGGKAVIIDLPGAAAEAFAAEHPDHLRFAPADVRDADAVQAAVDLASELGELRTVVNCAGTGNAIRTVGRDGTPFPLESFAKIVEINLIGTFNVIRLAAARIASLDPIGEERGVIVNTASVAAFDGQIGQAAYAASKAGVVGLTLPIARDLSKQAIRVNTIAPGLFDTPLMATMPDEAREALGKTVPHPSRLGNPVEFGALAVHIVENPMLNGETIRLDGAIRMGLR
ncbi:3-hydroxyacyl-CoA dehydrogenase [Rhodococcoides yunnanense]|uniref:3-hydroxyacyl-CoA dehydrogenase n=1 Tax=Rhodococcoides yunnanense TaxID=278209 RepID=UPI000932D1FC|nr:3-hydroxyacyl-CoA dehydrogenase [Rhodococcus yunnanensis]